MFLTSANTFRAFAQAIVGCLLFVTADIARADNASQDAASQIRRSVSFGLDEERISLNLNLGASGQSGPITWSVSGEHISYSDETNNRWDVQGQMGLLLYSDAASEGLLSLGFYFDHYDSADVWQRVTSLAYDHSYRIGDRTSVGGTIEYGHTKGSGAVQDFDQFGFTAYVSTRLDRLRLMAKTQYRHLMFYSGLDETQDNIEISVAYPLGEGTIASLRLAEGQTIDIFELRDQHLRLQNNVFETNLRLQTPISSDTRLSAEVSHRNRTAEDLSLGVRRANLTLSHQLNEQASLSTYAEISHVSGDDDNYYDQSIGLSLKLNF
jgi:hypothetical protein